LTQINYVRYRTFTSRHANLASGSQFYRRANLKIFVIYFRPAERKFPQSVLWMNCDRNDRCKGYIHHDKIFAPERTPRAGSSANATKRQRTGTKEGTSGKGSAGGSGSAGSASGPSGARRAAISGSAKSRRTATAGSAEGRSTTARAAKSRRIATSSPAAGRSAAARPAKNRRAGA
jgi:hypothetical protein